jgi:hypothetical protein
MLSQQLAYHLNEYRFLWTKDSLSLFTWYYLFFAIPYLLIAFAASVGLSRSLRGYSTRHKIQPISPTASQIIREIFYSMLTIAIFSFVAIYVFASSRVHDKAHSVPLGTAGFLAQIQETVSPLEILPSCPHFKLK